MKDKTSRKGTCAGDRGLWQHWAETTRLDRKVLTAASFYSLMGTCAGAISAKGLPLFLYGSAKTISCGMFNHARRLEMIEKLLLAARIMKDRHMGPLKAFRCAMYRRASL